MINKIIQHLNNFNSVRKCSNVFVAFKTEILSVFVSDLEKKQQLIQNTKLKYLKMQYADIIEAYSKKANVLKATQPIVWIMWWQGYDKMPPIVRTCYKSVNQHVSENVKVILLTKDNYSDYVKIPNYILEKVDKGIISLTHLSDIIRMACIANHGGIWLDSTIFVTKDIPDRLITGNFFSLSTSEDCHFVSMCKWSSFAIGGANVVFDYMTALFYTHWKKYNHFIDYYSIDYGLRLYYDASKSFRTVVSENSVYTENLYVLQNSLNEEYNEEIMNNLIATTMFCKLTWKGNLVSSKDGKETFYGHLISKYE